jgi:hypothetical protein
MASAKMANSVGAMLDMAGGGGGGKNEPLGQDQPPPEADEDERKWRTMAAHVQQGWTDRMLFRLADDIGLALPRGMARKPRGGGRG